MNRDSSATTAPPAASYRSRVTWSAERPRVLVVACSDGRLQENIDDFLNHHLGILHYDRIYVPGGPGALAASGYEFLRADQFCRESAQLIAAHGTQEVILIFHGAAEDGPADATCADYRRKMPSRTPAEIHAAQREDALALLRGVACWPAHLRLRAFRAEVHRDGSVNFVPMGVR